MRVFRIALVVGLLIGLTAAVSAQDVSLGGRLSAGPTWFGGGDWDDVHDDDDVDNLLGFGFGVDLLAEIGLAPNFAVRTGLGYARHAGGIKTDDGELTVSSNLLSLPVYLKPGVEVGPGSLYGLIGPQLSFVVGDVSSEADLNGLSFEDSDEPDNRLLFGLGLGGGYAIALDDGLSLFFDTVFSTTFNSPSDPDDNDDLFGIDDGPRLRGVSIGAGVTTSF